MAKIGVVHEFSQLVYSHPRVLEFTTVTLNGTKSHPDLSVPRLRASFA
jgi:hypothetical protein